MEALCITYRSLSARPGKVEFAVHFAFVLYGLLLCTATLLNVISPSWVSRNNQDYLLSKISLQETSSLPASPLSLFRPPPLSVPQEHVISRCITRGFLLDLFDDPVVTRVRDEMHCGCHAPKVYEKHETPTACAIVQSYNHVDNIDRIAHALISNPAIDEIIVCEDGSSDGSLERWTENLRGKRHFIVVSNNLHEVRCYNRAMRLSSAQYFILLQDDDIPPIASANLGADASGTMPQSSSDDTTNDSGGDSPNFNSAGSSSHAVTDNWVTHAKALFEADPKLGLLSGYIGQMWDPATGEGFEFGEQTSDHGGQRKGSTYRLPFLSRKTNHPFMYCECAWAAPLFIRAEALHRVGGLDVGLFNKGEPGVWQDCVLSYATWTAGWRVGVYDATFRRGVGGHGSTSSGEKTKMRGVVWQRAKKACDERYDRKYIHSHVLMLNNEALQQRYDHPGNSSHPPGL